MCMFSVSEIQQYISNIDFPIGKDDLIRLATEHGAPPQLISIFERFTDKQYHGPDEVTQEASQKISGSFM